MRETRINCLIVFFVVLIFLSSCTGRGGNDSTETYSFEVERESVFIDIPFSTSPSLTYPVLWDSLGDEYLVAYNFQIHGLDVFNLSKRVYLKQIKLETEGPNFVSSVQAISIWSNEMILIVNDSYVTLMNFDGEVVDRLIINKLDSDFTGFDFSHGRLLVNRYSGLQFDKRAKTIMMEAYLFDSNNDLGNGFLLVELDVEQKNIEVIDIPYKPSLLYPEVGYGELNGLNFLRLENSLVLNHKFSSEVFLWKKGKLESRKVLSSFTVNKAEPFSRNGVARESRHEYDLKSVKFFPLVFDPIRKLYFRLHRSQLETIDDSADFYVTVMDSDFRKIEEIPFSKGYYIFPIVSREGLLFLAFNKHDNQIELLNIKCQLN